ncbi:hypothetical protein PC119_g20315 [Phytophthora cactorum]|nr:hypothetical protein PC119_g20315 [Phytophthora cactorum]
MLCLRLVTIFPLHTHSRALASQQAWELHTTKRYRILCSTSAQSVHAIVWLLSMSKDFRLCSTVSAAAASTLTVFPSQETRFGMDARVDLGLSKFGRPVAN